MSMDAVGHTATRSARALLRWQFEHMRRLLDATAEQLMEDTNRHNPPDGITRARVCYARAVLSEDLGIHGVLAVGPPLALSTWSRRTGLSDLPPLIGPIEWHLWGRQVRLDMEALHAYAQAVHAVTDSNLADWCGESLNVTHGDQPLRLLSALLLTQAMRRGEIACLLANI
jgi:hypothetical protein